MSPDHITAGAYDQNIDKCLAHHMVWLHKTRSLPDIIMSSADIIITYNIPCFRYTFLWLVLKSSLYLIKHALSLALFWYCRNIMPYVSRPLMRSTILFRPHLWTWPCKRVCIDTDISNNWQNLAIMHMAWQFLQTFPFHYTIFDANHYIYMVLCLAITLLCSGIIPKDYCCLVVDCPGLS